MRLVSRRAFKLINYEYGFDLRYIQTLLGHEFCKTTKIYTYVSDRFLCKIKSSLDVVLEIKSMDDKELSE